MANPLQTQQTPMSSKLTSMLILLREDCPDDEILTDPDKNDSKAVHQAQNDGETDDIILGGDVCNCRKSKCLKLYCQCFNAARVCNSMCRCVNCSNTDSNESGRSEAVKIILDRNPAAFDSKFLSRDLQAYQPAHKSGCKCRKSMCLKKYCECFEASLPCSSTCVCVECHNTSSHVTLNAGQQGPSSINMSSTSRAQSISSRQSKGTGKAKVRQVHAQGANRKSVQKGEISMKTSTCSPTAPDSSQSSVSNTVTSEEKSIVEDLPLQETDALSESSASVGQPRRTDHLSRPPLPHYKRQCPEPNSTIFQHHNSKFLSNLGIDGIGLNYVTRPTMLSRVVTVKKRCRDQDRFQGSSSGSLELSESCLIPLDHRDTIAEKSVGCVAVQSLDFGIGRSSTIPVKFLSPVGAAMPVTSQVGRHGLASTDLNRFVSPNTASVASALSLLSRLPYCKPTH